MFKLFLIAALLIGAVGIAVSSTGQQALADKVGPNCPCPPGNEDQLTQGGLGEFYSKQGKETYFGPDITGQQFGQERGNIASSNPGVIGSNTAYYGSGECHGKVPDACT
jgi:hypothetical protein